jgi:chemotaxis response regulator CheB
MSYSFSALVIDDDSTARDVIENFFDAKGWLRYCRLSSPLGAMEKIEMCKPDVIFLLSICPIRRS